ncbi:HWE histidine kinase domain-containing protein [Reyranella sp.]|jgi:light-regulated signal transduction histidine kinase (bacteriophytochrome)/CheY-like chemotaxis protein|uniref:HWE histidine kinase domain-containing protein n=1 Tax=Reyranella sp. TaxID=1929291 RepID=UPI000BD11092|nr:HWE histidine kinase domain-containing protein [Reyranella sp.]OYY46742.1 MAG: two-component system sensor histidine kinase/response regulator [Rhodospirillales bacterium 35-66-84]OYZ96762.1 MAG: two-component system sensor histidine kinase/response regulator [Rhodospirillales bacterium 24-66-33]OZB27911.1 MAG: two-component system sensor histidine kinase/response regulator [Rhodospirillales bacterium 39-66-50]HQS13647.1 GAF domain-containing protein [Reyranella sp.]HQT10132.1 GAF domain-co
MPELPTPAVDLTNCDREPIHLLGAVQPFGFLIALDSTQWIITRLSSNATAWLRAGPAELVGRPIEDVFTHDAIHLIRGQLQTAVFTSTVARAFSVALLSDGSCFDLAVHVNEDTIVIECEPCIDEQGVNSGALVRAMIARLQLTSELRTFYRVAAREMRGLTGFDRVMVYRFDHDGSGEVIAESARGGLESYLGLHYPASDIPQQARILYERNWLRIIPDISAKPVAIEPSLIGGRPLDLSMSVLRSVSPIHIEYLQNMGVGASMSVSILRDGKLWGLFACHHYGRHTVPFERRTAAELFGQMFSLLMESRERDGEAAYEARARQLHNQLVTVMATEATRFDSIVSHLDEIADLLSCDGIGVWTGGHATLQGMAPTQDQFVGLIDHLTRRDLGDVLACHEIAAEYPPGRDFADRAAGMLVVPLSRPARDFLVFFRKEVARSVNWAGDPSKPVVVGPLGARLTPRKSFELWRETVSGQSAPWQPVDIRIAESLRVSLLEVILRLSDITEIERRRSQERQELLIAELNHRVRNILGLIRGVISQSRDPSLTADAFTDVVGGRIQALARAHDQITADNWGPASFRGLVVAEAGAYLGGKATRVRLAGPEMLLEPQGFTTVALVMHELMTNSAKYGALSDSSGAIDIATRLDAQRNLHITWTEQGGPPVKAPTRRGFGSTVIERSIPYDLKGEATVDYEVTGVRASFVVPAAYVRLAPGALAEAPAEAAPEAGAADLPKDVLIVEDNMIIALDAESSILRAGIETVRVASSVAQAMRAIGSRPPEFALLDINLGRETSFAVAEHLDSLGIPFVFTTGYGEDIAFPPKLLGVPRIRKPYTGDALLMAMRR